MDIGKYIFVLTISNIDMRRAKKELRGYFCPKCGERVGQCRHENSFFYVGEWGEQVAAAE
jgi:hypothetical protein